MLLARYTLLFFITIRAGVDVLFGASRLEGGGFSPGALLNVVAIALFIFSVAIRRGEHLKVLVLIWSPYLLVAAFSLTYTSDLMGGLRLFFSTLTFPAVFGSALLLLRTERQVGQLFMCVIYSSFFTTLVAVYQIVRDGHGVRLQSTLSHPNIFAFYILAVILAILYYLQMRRASAGRKLVYYGYIMLQLVFLLLTQTRNAWIAGVALAGFYAIGVDRRLLLAVPIVPLLLLLPPVADRFSDVNPDQTATFEEVENGSVVLNSYTWRKKLWDSALIDSEDYRVLGKGLNSFAKNSTSFFPLSLGGEAHSGYVQAIYEVGIVGLLAYLWLYVGPALIAIAWRGPNMTKRTWLIVAFAFVNLIINYADNISYYLPYNWYVWAILGADLALRYSARQARARSTAVNPQPTPMHLVGQLPQYRMPS